MMTIRTFVSWNAVGVASLSTMNGYKESMTRSSESKVDEQ